MRDRATKIKADAQRVVSNAQRARSGAIAGIQTQERAIAALRVRRQDTAAAETLLEHFRVIRQRSEDDLARAIAPQTEVTETPPWRLNNG